MRDKPGRARQSDGNDAALHRHGGNLASEAPAFSRSNSDQITEYPNI
jgi:hypothetical protein